MIIIYYVCLLMSSTKTNLLSPGEKIGKYIKYKRNQKQISLNEFAKLADITPSFLLRLENGAYQSLKIDFIIKLARGLQISLEDFLRKCELIERTKDEKLPDLKFYLKEKFQFPDGAIEDTSMFIKFLQERYAGEINTMKKAHREYWETSEQN